MASGGVTTRQEPVHVPLDAAGGSRGDSEAIEGATASPSAQAPSTSITGACKASGGVTTRQEPVHVPPAVAEGSPGDLKVHDCDIIDDIPNASGASPDNSNLIVLADGALTTGEGGQVPAPSSPPPSSTWDTSKVTTMGAMFNGASTFDQDIAADLPCPGGQDPSTAVSAVGCSGIFENGQVSVPTCARVIVDPPEDLAVNADEQRLGLFTASSTVTAGVLGVNGVLASKEVEGIAASEAVAGATPCEASETEIAEQTASDAGVDDIAGRQIAGGEREADQAGGLDDALSRVDNGNDHVLVPSKTAGSQDGKEDGSGDVRGRGWGERRDQPMGRERGRGHEMSVDRSRDFSTGRGGGRGGRGRMNHHGGTVGGFTQPLQYGVVAFRAGLDRSNFRGSQPAGGTGLIVIHSHSERNSSHDLYYFIDYGNKFRNIPHGTAVNFIKAEGEESYTHARKVGLRVNQLDFVTLEVAKGIYEVCDAEKRMALPGVFQSRYFGKRSHLGLEVQKEGESRPSFYGFLNPDDIQLPEKGTKCLVSLAWCQGLQLPVLASLTLDPGTFTNLSNVVPADWCDYYQKSYLREEGGLLISIGGGKRDDLPGYALWALKVFKDGPSFGKVIEALMAHSKNQLLCGDTEVTRRDRYQRIIDIINSKGKVVFIISTPHHSALKWKMMADQYFMKAQTSLNVDKILVLTSFDSRTASKGITFSGNDFGQLFAIDPGRDSLEEVLISTHVKPWQEVCDPDDPACGFSIVNIFKLFGFLVLSTKGCVRSRDTSSLAPVVFEREYGKENISVEVSISDEDKILDGLEVWVRWAHADSKTCVDILNGALNHCKDLARMGHQGVFGDINGLTGCVIRPKNAFGTKEQCDAHDQAMWALCYYLQATSLFFAMPGKAVIGASDNMVTLTTSKSFPYNPSNMLNLLAPTTKPTPNRPDQLAWLVGPNLFRIWTTDVPEKAVACRRRLEKKFKRYNELTSRGQGFGPSKGHPLVAFFVDKPADETTTKVYYLYERKHAGGFTPWAGSLELTRANTKCCSTSYILGASPTFSNKVTVDILRACGLRTDMLSFKNACFAMRLQGVKLRATGADGEISTLLIPPFTPFIKVPHFSKEDQQDFLKVTALHLPGDMGASLRIVEADGDSWKDRVIGPAYRQPSAQSVANSTNLAGAVAPTPRTNADWGSKQAAALSTLQKEERSAQKKFRAGEVKSSLSSTKASTNGGTQQGNAGTEAALEGVSECAGTVVGAAVSPVPVVQSTGKDKDDYQVVSYDGNRSRKAKKAVPKKVSDTTVGGVKATPSITSASTVGHAAMGPPKSVDSGNRSQPKRSRSVDLTQTAVVVVSPPTNNGGRQSRSRSRGGTQGGRSISSHGGKRSKTGPPKVATGNRSPFVKGSGAKAPGSSLSASRIASEANLCKVDYPKSSPLVIKDNLIPQQVQKARQHSPGNGDCLFLICIISYLSVLVPNEEKFQAGCDTLFGKVPSSSETTDRATRQGLANALYSLRSERGGDILDNKVNRPILAKCVKALRKRIFDRMNIMVEDTIWTKLIGSEDFSDYQKPGAYAGLGGIEAFANLTGIPVKVTLFEKFSPEARAVPVNEGPVDRVSNRDELKMIETIYHGGRPYMNTRAPVSLLFAKNDPDAKDFHSGFWDETTNKWVTCADHYDGLMKEDDYCPHIDTGKRWFKPPEVFPIFGAERTSALANLVTRTAAETTMESLASSTSLPSTNTSSKGSDLVAQAGEATPDSGPSGGASPTPN